ncbi:MAG TPA: hypothetical protein VKX25_10745 [Bryobacteraceae bacterium]|jgi:hypothetical protein|nr:hypothetical protein [Bryobacteraceae bacterium]
MDRDTITRTYTENVGRWVRVRYTDGVDQFVYIINVDEEGYVHKLNNDDDMQFWTTFDDVESVCVLSDHDIAEQGLGTSP